MSTSLFDGPSASSSSTTHPPLTGWRAALEHTGIPASWIRRPRLPSPKVSMFLATVAGVTGAWYYDRQQCKVIRQEFVDKVKHLADEPLATWDKPRKVTVYACKWPGDENYDSSLKWFKRNIKPILVAAGVDYEFSNGNQYGALMRSIADDIKAKRRLAAGIDKPKESPIPQFGPPEIKTEADKRRRELEGGVIVIGRHTFKEYMEGLRRGWSESMMPVDHDEILAKELEHDGHFAELVVESDTLTDDASLPPPPPPPPANKPAQSPVVFSPLQLQIPPRQVPPPPPTAAPSIPSHLDQPPSRIPDQPPLELVPYTSILGFLNIPLMLWGFFNHRKDVRMGAEAAYRVVAGATRPFDEPPSTTSFSEDGEEEVQSGDLAFDVAAESYYRSAYADTPKEIENARKSYYDGLKSKLKVARELARHEREATKDEVAYPPPTEVELSDERLKKERKWRDALDGWSVLKQGKGVSWDERFQGAFRVFVDGQVPPPPKSVPESGSSAAAE